MPGNIKEKIEGKIIDWIALGSGGRLIATKPDKGADLVVQKKGDYSGKKIFLNLEIFEKAPEDKQNLPENFYLLAVKFDLIKQKIEEKIWLFPEFKEQIDQKIFINFLIGKLILENKPEAGPGFKRKQY